MEVAVADKKSVLVVGLDPALIDFSQPGYAPGMNTTKVLAGIKSSEKGTGHHVGANSLISLMGDFNS